VLPHQDARRTSDSSKEVDLNSYGDKACVIVTDYDLFLYWLPTILNFWTRSPAPTSPT